MRGCRLRSALLILTLGGTTLMSGSARGQSAQGSGLLTLDSGAVVVQYSPGALDRAVRVHDALFSLVEDFAKWAQAPVLPGAWVLARREWEEGARSRPYGLGEVVAPGRVALPAIGDESTVRIWKRLLGGSLPLGVEPPIRGTPEEAASLGACDQLAWVELGRSLVRAGGLEPSEAWIIDLLGHVQALEAVGGPFSPGGLAADGFFQTVERAQATRAAPLTAFQTGVEFERWLWFQAQFHHGAKILFERDKRSPMKKVAKMQGNGKSGTLGKAQLLERYPDLGVWLRSFPAP